MPKLILASSNKGKIKEFAEIFKQESVTQFELAAIDEFLSDFDPEETGSSYIANAVIKLEAALAMLNEKFSQDLTHVTLPSTMQLKTFCLADDSGIEITALGGAPGIHSGRYLRKCGLQYLADEINTKNPLDRSCKFICSLAFSAVSTEAEPLEDKTPGFKNSATNSTSTANQNPILIQVEWPGWVISQPRGAHGFGFDPLVIPEEEILTVFSGINELKQKFSSNPSATEQILSKLKTVAELDENKKNIISHRAKAIKKLLIQISADSPSSQSAA